VVTITDRATDTRTRSQSNEYRLAIGMVQVNMRTSQLKASSSYQSTVSEQ